MNQVTTLAARLNRRSCCGMGGRATPRSGRSSPRRNRPPPMQRGNSCLIGKIPRPMGSRNYARGFDSALTSNEERVKTLCYEIAKRHEGHEKEGRSYATLHNRQRL
jgi:hypothetical protein